MKKGEGPSEIEGANGFRVDTLGAIWVNDHGRGWKVTRLKDGQFTTYPMPALQYGFVWSGSVTHAGQIWDFGYQPLDGSSPMSPLNRPSGVLKTEFSVLLKSLDPASGAVDSVALGTRTAQSVAFPGVVVSIPLVAEPLFAIDPAGAVWTAMSDVDRLVKLSAEGDTLLIVELPGIGPEATSAERTAEIEKRTQALGQRGQTNGSASIDWESLVPKRKPVLVNLSVDDQSRLWVQRRTLSRGPVFDVIDANGQLLGSIDPDFEPAEYLPPVIRGKSFYAVVTDSLDVPTVIRAPVPLR
jgi:streptogramin lyase